MNPREVILRVLADYELHPGDVDRLLDALCPPGGRVVVSRESKVCEACGGGGWATTADARCPVCGGSGVVEATTTRPMPDLTAEQCEWARRWAATQPYGTNATDAVARIVNAVLAAVALPEDGE